MAVIINWSLAAKLSGSIIVIASSVLGGLYLSVRDSFRIHDLCEMKKALTILKSEIVFASAPLPEAFRNISKRIDKPINTIFEILAERLDERNREGMYEIWTDVLVQASSRTYFTNEDIERLCSFGKTLGYLDKTMQISAIDLQIECIEEKVELLNHTADTNKRMYRSLGILGGLLAVVIFL